MSILVRGGSVDLEEPNMFLGDNDDAVALDTIQRISGSITGGWRGSYIEQRVGTIDNDPTRSVIFKKLTLSWLCIPPKILPHLG